MAVWKAITSFNAGELSPKMVGRSDVSQYHKGCQKLENFFVTPYGAVERRGGLRFIAKAKTNSQEIRLIRFVFSSTVAYVCEFGNLYIRFYRDGSMVQEIASPYSGSQIASIQFVQSADVMTLCHEAHPVMELRRLLENRFELREKEFRTPPMLEPNLDDSFTLTPAGNLSNGGSVTLTASKDCFTAENVGGFFQLIHTRKANEISIDFTADGVSGSLEVYGYWNFTTHGTWSGIVKIQRSFDKGATWQDFRTYGSQKDQNHSADGNEESEDVLYRIKMEDYEASTSGTLKLCRCLLVNSDFVVTGIVKVTVVHSAKSASGTVIRKLGGTEPTAEWNEGAWSRRRGFPRALAYYEERMMFGGTFYRPQTVWGSKTNAWDQFLLGDKDDDGLEFTLSSDTVNSIEWLCQHNALIIGTMDSEWTLSASSSDAALTPSNFRVKRQSVYGSSHIPAKMVGEVLLFVQRGDRKVREFVYTWEKDGYTAPDMTVLADHITASGIRETSLQQQPDSILWCVLNDGTVAALTYEREQEVIGWQKHATEGKVLSCCVIPAGKEDEIFLAVDRNGIVCVEKMAARRDLRYFSDSFKEYSGNKLTELAGLDHLEGQLVKIRADYAVQRDKTVKNGKVLLDDECSYAVVGLPYASNLSVMPIEVETQNGSSMLRRKAIGELRIRLYDSVGGQCRCGQGQWQQIISRDILQDTMDKAVTEKTEVIRLGMLSGYEEATTIEIRQEDPLPMNITAITVNYEVNE